MLRSIRASHDLLGEVAIWGLWAHPTPCPRHPALCPATPGQGEATEGWQNSPLGQRMMSSWRRHKQEEEVKAQPLGESLSP